MLRLLCMLMVLCSVSVVGLGQCGDTVLKVIHPTGRFDEKNPDYLKSNTQYRVEVLGINPLSQDVSLTGEGLIKRQVTSTTFATFFKKFTDQIPVLSNQALDGSSTPKSISDLERPLKEYLAAIESYNKKVLEINAIITNCKQLKNDYLLASNYKVKSLTPFWNLIKSIKDNKNYQDLQSKYQREQENIESNIIDVNNKYYNMLFYMIFKGLEDVDDFVDIVKSHHDEFIESQLSDSVLNENYNFVLESSRLYSELNNLEESNVKIVRYFKTPSSKYDFYSIKIFVKDVTTDSTPTVGTYQLELPVRKTFRSSFTTGIFVSTLRDSSYVLAEKRDGTDTTYTLTNQSNQTGVTFGVMEYFNLYYSYGDAIDLGFHVGIGGRLGDGNKVQPVFQIGGSVLFGYEQSVGIHIGLQTGPVQRLSASQIYGQTYAQGTELSTRNVYRTGVSFGISFNPFGSKTASSGEEEDKEE